MKRTVIAVALAVFAAPALALEVGLPYEQLNVDRQLPDIQISQDRQVKHYAEAANADTRTDAAAGASADAEAPAESPWADDPNFIAPPQ